MKKFFGNRGASSQDGAVASSLKGTPETRVAKSIKAFCESAAPNNSQNGGGDEVTHLPTIVDAAESSPTAAVAAAYTIRKLLKDNYFKPYIQYNAVMLIRILADNPGPAFTKGFDAKFLATVQHLLTHCRDPSVQQLLRETLYNFEHNKAAEPNLAALLDMWRAEQNSYPGGRAPPPGMGQSPAQAQAQAQLAQSRSRRPKTLPPPEELAARIAEARTSAQLLIQLCHSTAPADVPNDELLKEFSDRCIAANKNLHGYMECTEPAAPDQATFATLIETCEYLNLANSTHQRAVLESRKRFGPASAAATPPPVQSPEGQGQVPQAQGQVQNGQPYRAQTQTQPPKPRPTYTPAVNPFSDDNQIEQHDAATTNGVNSGAHELAAGDVAPPPGPPPKTHQPYEYTDDDADLYGTGPPVPAKDVNGERRVRDDD